MLFACFLFTSCTWQNSHVEALHANYLGKIKSRKKSLGKEKENTGPKMKEIARFCQKKKKSLAESDKNSWSGQTPSTISASAEDPEQANILGASYFLTRALPLWRWYCIDVLKWTWPSARKKPVAMRCFSREIVTYCHRRWEVLFGLRFYRAW